MVESDDTLGGLFASQDDSTDEEFGRAWHRLCGVYERGARALRATLDIGDDLLDLIPVSQSPRVSVPRADGPSLT